MYEYEEHKETQEEYREKRIIGIILHKPQAAYIAFKKLNSEYFSNTAYKAIFEAMKRVYKEKGTISIEAVGAAMPNRSDTSEMLDKIQAEINPFLTAENLDETIQEIVKEKIIEKIQAEAHSGKAPEDIKQNIKSLLEQLEHIQERGKARPDNMQEYLKSMFNSDLELFQRSNLIKTGFKNYDNETGGLFPSLYVIGAISSLGKTTFIHQMCDNIAQSGTPVLFFSLEQSALELVTKSIARINAKHCIEQGIARADLSVYCKPAIYLRQHGIQTEQSKSALEEYKSTIADNMHIIEGNFNTNAEYIREYVNSYISRTGRAPVVVVDYLQIMQAPTGNGNKDSVDFNVTELKRISRDFNIPVFVISAFNRTNYMNQISFESFRESSGIEYTADVLLGLQLKILSEKEFNPDGQNNVNARREKFKEAKNKVPREIQLCCIKNRNGKTSFDLNFLYFPNFDLFIPNETPVMPVTPAKRKQL